MKDSGECEPTVGNSLQPHNRQTDSEVSNHKCITVLARVSRPGCLSWEVCKSDRGGLHEGGWLYNIFLYIWEGGGLREILSKDMGVAYTRGRLTRASTVFFETRWCNFQKFIAVQTKIILTNLLSIYVTLCRTYNVSHRNLPKLHVEWTDNYIIYHSLLIYIATLNFRCKKKQCNFTLLNYICHIIVDRCNRTSMPIKIYKLKSRGG